MEHKLYKAAMEGNVTSLHELLEDDPLVLDKVTLMNCFNETPLHVAAMRGHSNFVKEIVGRNRELAGELDSKGLSPLHWASAKGHVEIVKALLLADPEMCFARDRDGRNPLHLAAIKGRLSVLKQLVEARPEAARATVPDQQGATILHLCVHHNRLEALKLLLETMKDDEFANSKDDHHNTILDLAIVDKQIETIKYLLWTSVAIDVNANNGNRLTAIRARDIHTSSSVVVSSGNENGTSIRRPEQPFCIRVLQNLVDIFLDSRPPEKFMKEIRTGLMVVASVMLTLTFQIGVNPPGGVWQEDKPAPNPHKAGEIIMAYTSPNRYIFIYFANVASFVTSMIAMMILLIPIPLKDNFIVTLFGYMLSTFVILAATYGVAIGAITPDMYKQPNLSSRLKTEVVIALAVPCAFLIPPLLVIGIRVLGRWLKSRGLIINIWQLERP